MSNSLLLLLQSAAPAAATIDRFAACFADVDG